MKRIDRTIGKRHPKCVLFVNALLPDFFSRGMPHADVRIEVKVEGDKLYLYYRIMGEDFMPVREHTLTLNADDLHVSVSSRKEG